MQTPHLQSPKKKYKGKDTELFLDHIIREIEAGTGQSLSELQKKLPEDVLFYVGLVQVTTTKKAICTALDIPVEGACWYKRRYEKDGKIKEVFHGICPITGFRAAFLSANQSLINSLI